MKKMKLILSIFVAVVTISIQAQINAPGKAQEKVNDLRKYCKTTKNINKNIKGKFKDDYYCRKYVDYITELRGGMLNQYIYKVHYNIYRSKEEAEKDWKIIKKFKSCKDAWIKPIVKVKD
jgi:hypothetical protein